MMRAARRRVSLCVGKPCRTAPRGVCGIDRLQMLADGACTMHVYLRMCLDGLRAWQFAVFNSVQAWSSPDCNCALCRR